MRKIVTSASQTVREEKNISHCRVCDAIILKGQKFCYDHKTGVNKDTVKGE